MADPRSARIDDPQQKPSFLLVALDQRKVRNPRTALAPVEGASLVPDTIPYYGYIGPILSPMVAFSKVVHDRPSLQPAYGVAAERYLQAAKAALHTASGLFVRVLSHSTGAVLGSLLILRLITVKRLVTLSYLLHQTKLRWLHTQHLSLSM